MVGFAMEGHICNILFLLTQRVDLGVLAYIAACGKCALKALCHAIRADCLLIEAACTHVLNQQWAWQIADKFVCTFKPAR